MKRITLFYSFVLLAIATLTISLRSYGQMVFTASVSAAKMGVQDQIRLTYSLQDPQNITSVGPEDGTFKDFHVVQGPSQSQSTQINMVGNQMQQSVTLNITYILKPKKTGTFTVPAGVAKDNGGHTFTSNTAQVQVVKGSLAAQQQQYDPYGGDPFAAMRQHQAMIQRMMQQQQGQRQQQQAQPQAQNSETTTDLGKDLFIKVQVDKSKVHVGEQITASYKLYARVPMNMQISKLPSLNGFWTQDFQLAKDRKPVEEIVNGKKYQVFTLKKSALFPQQPGTLTLDPAEAQGIARVIQKVQQHNPFDDPFFQQAFGGSLAMNDPFFNNGFFNSLQYRDVRAHIKSEPVKVTVTELPEKGKPANYGNAVGNFTIDAKIDKTDFTTDDAANLKLTINGSGNLKLIEAPVLKLPNGMDSYDPMVVDTITGRTTTISGSKIITYPLGAHTPGDYEIPAIAFSYYNPESNSYSTINTQPIKVHVKQGKNYNPNLAKNSKALKDIHGIDTKPLTKLNFNSKPLLYTVGYWSMYGTPLLAFLIFAVYRRREDELSKDVVKLKSRKANKVALKRLKEAQKLLLEKKQSQFYEEVSKAIWLYLADKLNIPMAELSRERAQDALNARGISETLLKQAEFVIQECETALYAPSGGSQQMQHTYQEAINVISNLEEKFN